MFYNEIKTILIINICTIIITLSYSIQLVISVILNPRKCPIFNMPTAVTNLSPLSDMFFQVVKLKLLHVLCYPQNYCLPMLLHVAKHLIALINYADRAVSEIKLYNT